MVNDTATLDTAADTARFELESVGTAVFDVTVEP
jgi:hypothetical protein